jgi:hypothetical protein
VNLEVLNSEEKLSLLPKQKQIKKTDNGSQVMYWFFKFVWLVFYFSLCSDPTNPSLPPTQA